MRCWWWHPTRASASVALIRTCTLRAARSVALSLLQANVITVGEQHLPTPRGLAQRFGQLSRLTGLTAPHHGAQYVGR